LMSQRPSGGDPVIRRWLCSQFPATPDVPVVGPFPCPAGVGTRSDAPCSGVAESSVSFASGRSMFASRKATPSASNSTGSPNDSLQVRKRLPHRGFRGEGRPQWEDANCSWSYRLNYMMRSDLYPSSRRGWRSCSRGAEDGRAVSHRSLLRPPEFGAVRPDTLQDDGQPASGSAMLRRYPGLA
jgi:hypothetical protein